MRCSRFSRRLGLLFVLSSWVAVDLHAAGGTIEGKVLFNGRPKRNPLIQMGADPNCLQINAGKKTVQEYVDLHSDRTVGDVFVHITDDLPAPGPAPERPVLVDQKGCIFLPRVAGMMVGQTLRVRNSDNAIHSVKSESGVGNSFNVGQPQAGMENDFAIDSAEVMLKLICTVHDWMVSFVGVKRHPYFAVSSGEDGSFRIEGVPPGTYTLEAWQQVLGTLEQQVEVKEGETVTVELAYGSASASRPSSLPLEELILPTR